MGLGIHVHAKYLDSGTISDILGLCSSRAACSLVDNACSLVHTCIYICVWVHTHLIPCVHMCVHVYISVCMKTLFKSLINKEWGMTKLGMTWNCPFTLVPDFRPYSQVTNLSSNGRASATERGVSCVAHRETGKRLEFPLTLVEQVVVVLWGDWYCQRNTPLHLICKYLGLATLSWFGYFTMPFCHEH